MHEEVHVQRTVMLKLSPTHEQAKALSQLQAAYNNICNKIVPFVVENRCWNNVALHDLSYYPIRDTTHLGSQMGL